MWSATSRKIYNVYWLFGKNRSKGHVLKELILAINEIASKAFCSSISQEQNASLGCLVSDQLTIHHPSPYHPLVSWRRNELVDRSVEFAVLGDWGQMNHAMMWSQFHFSSFRVVFCAGSRCASLSFSFILLCMMCFLLSFVWFVRVVTRLFVFLRSCLSLRTSPLRR